MEKKVYTKGAPDPVGPYSQAIMAGNFLYCSGQIPIDPRTGLLCGGDITAQTVKICENLGAVLAAAGMSFENVVKTTCFLSDMNDFGSFNEVYARYFISSPARSCVAVKTLPKGALAEIDVIAYKNQMKA